MPRDVPTTDPESLDQERQPHQAEPYTQPIQIFSFPRLRRDQACDGHCDAYPRRPIKSHQLAVIIENL